MDRRGFLTGLLVSTAAASCTALVRLASAEETKSLTVGERMMVKQPSRVEMPGHKALGATVFLQNGRGDFVPIGFVTRFNINARVNDLTDWDGEIRYVPGLRTADIQFEGGFI